MPIAKLWWFAGTPSLALSGAHYLAACPRPDVSMIRRIAPKSIV